MHEPVKTIMRPAAVESGVSLEVEPMGVAALVGVRCTRVYVQTLLGLLSAGGLGAMPGWMPGDLWVNVQQAALLSLAPVVFTFLQNTLELLARLDERNPRWRA